MKDIQVKNKNVLFIGFAVLLSGVISLLFSYYLLAYFLFKDTPWYVGAVLLLTIILLTGGFVILVSYFILRMFDTFKN